MSYKIQKRILLISFLAIPLVLLFLFLIYPTFRLFYMSFTNWDGVLPTRKFIGLDNYKNVFTTPEVWFSLKNNLFYLINGLVQNILALLFAVILQTKLKGKNFFKAVIFVTFVINSAAVGYMFNYIYDFDKGPLNTMFVNLGLGQVHFLSDSFLVNISVVLVCLWRYTGYTMVLYIAALQSVHDEWYEAAMIDGANAWQSFRYITLPSIIRIVELNLFLCLSGSLQAFTEAFIMTKGGPGYSSSTFLIYVIKSAFEFNNYGLAAALSMSLLVLIVVFTIIQRKVLLRGGGDDNDTAIFKA